MAENLVLYNLDRVKGMFTRFAKDKGEFSYAGADYDTIQSTLDFIKKEMERNYNPKAHLKCGWKRCPKEFTGWGAHHKLLKHQSEAHREIGQLNSILLGGVVALLVDNLNDPSWLYKRTGSKVAHTISRLKRRGKDIPVDLLQAFYDEHDAYFDSVDPARKWHKPMAYIPPKGLTHVPGRNTIIKETAKSICLTLCGKKHSKEQRGR